MAAENHYQKTYFFIVVVVLLLFFPQEERVAVSKAKEYLESHLYSADDPYTTALTTYALTLLRSTYASAALRRLNSMAITQGNWTIFINIYYNN